MSPPSFRHVTTMCPLCVCSVFDRLLPRVSTMWPPVSGSFVWALASRVRQQPAMCLPDVRLCLVLCLGFGRASVRPSLPRVRFCSLVSAMCWLFVRYLSAFVPRKVVFSRERLRRVLRKKTSAQLHLIYIFTFHICTSTSSHLHICTSTSSHLHICTSTCLLIFTSTHQHLHIFTSAHLHLHICTSTSRLTSTSSHLQIYIFSHVHICRSTDLLTSADPHIYRSSRSSFNSLLRRGWCRRSITKVNPLRRSCVSKARNAGENAFWIGRAQPSAEIVRVEGAKCRSDCVLKVSWATLCGDRACRRREMQVSFTAATKLPMEF